MHTHSRLLFARASHSSAVTHPPRSTYVRPRAPRAVARFTETLDCISYDTPSTCVVSARAYIRFGSGRHDQHACVVIYPQKHRSCRSCNVRGRLTGDRIARRVAAAAVKIVCPGRGRCGVVAGHVPPRPVRLLLSAMWYVHVSGVHPLRLSVSLTRVVAVRSVRCYCQLMMFAMLMHDVGRLQMSSNAILARALSTIQHHPRLDPVSGSVCRQPHRNFRTNRIRLAS